MSASTDTNTKATMAVVRYLTSLRDPDSLIDQKKVEKVEAALAKADDPIKRLELRERLIRESTLDLDAIEADFVEHAKAWADAEGMSAQAFAAEGVKRDVLRRAGFSVAKQSRKRRKASVESTKRVSVDDVLSHLNALKIDATISAIDLAQTTGASTSTARKAVQRAIEYGTLVKDGQATDHDSPGRPPQTYRRQKAKALQAVG